LRRELDRRGLSDVRIFYRLAIPNASLRDDPGQLGHIVERLSRLKIDGLWLRTHPSGIDNCGPVVVRTLLRACRELHRLGVPVVFEKGGILGQALVAFGGVGAIECGVAGGESFDVGAYKEMPEASADGGFGPPSRVLLPELMAYLVRKEAIVFLANRLMRARYGCNGTCCALTGPAASVRDSRRHFLYRFIDRLRSLSTVPELRRSAVFVADVNRAVSGLVQAVAVCPSLAGTQRRLSVLAHSLDSAVQSKLVLRYSQPDFDYRRSNVPPTPAVRPHVVS